MFGGGPKIHSRFFDEATSKVQYPKVLLQCRTVVEKQEYVATGLLTYAEGEIAEIELDEHGRFKLGEAVKISIYSPVGIMVFHSTVIAKGIESIMILNSREISNKFGETRQFPRVKINASATISGVLGGGSHSMQLNVTDPSCTVDNISMGGIGLLLPKNEELKPSIKLQLCIKLQLEIPCTVEIVRVEDADHLQYIGAKYVELPDNIVNSLRSFILKQQLDAYYQNKKRL
ncbi:MAG: PilZ domain-containing protein [Paenibacillaceae bacterium]